MTQQKKIEDGGPAFPLFDGSAHYGGMTLRQIYAAHALQGLITHYGNGASKTSANVAAESAFMFADAMISAEKGGA